MRPQEVKEFLMEAVRERARDESGILHLRAKNEFGVSRSDYVPIYFEYAVLPDGRLITEGESRGTTWENISITEIAEILEYGEGPADEDVFENTRDRDDA